MESSPADPYAAPPAYAHPNPPLAPPAGLTPPPPPGPPSSLAAHVPAPGRGTRAPWVVAAVAVVVALVSTSTLAATLLNDRGRADEARDTDVAGVDGAALNERGFASPDDAVEYVVERVAAADLDGALQAFAVESMVAGYSFERESERLGVVAPTSWLPASAPGYRAVDAAIRRGNIGYQMMSLVRAVAAPDVDLDVTVTLDDGLTAAEIEADLAPEGLQGLAVLRIDELRPTARDGSDPFATMAAGYGADEMREVAILYDTPSGAALGGMQLVRYGDSWHVWNLNSVLLGLMLGELQPTSEGAYENAVRGING